jgi:hypothetical protein
MAFGIRLDIKIGAYRLSFHRGGLRQKRLEWGAGRFPSLMENSNKRIWHAHSRSVKLTACGYCH